MTNWNNCEEFAQQNNCYLSQAQTMAYSAWATCYAPCPLHANKFAHFCLLKRQNLCISLSLQIEPSPFSKF